MKKLIFKFWVINFFLSLTLYVLYRIMLINTETTETNMFEFILIALKIFLDIYFIAIFFIAVVVCSLTYFLNLNATIRNNIFYSFLTFVGIPIGIFLFYFIQLSFDFTAEVFDILQSYEMISLIYIFLTVILFIFFRRSVKKYETKISIHKTI